MKTASFVLREEHIEWLKKKAVLAGYSTASSILRRVLTEAMERDAQASAQDNRVTVSAITNSI